MNVMVNDRCRALSYYPFKQRVLAHLVLLCVGMLEEFLSLRKHLSGTHPGLAGCRAPALRAKSHVLALEHLLVQTGERPRSRLQGVCSWQEVGKAERNLNSPCLEGRRWNPREGVRELNPKGEPECCRSKGKGVLGRRTGRCKGLEHSSVQYVWRRVWGGDSRLS